MSSSSKRRHTNSSASAMTSLSQTHLFYYAGSSRDPIHDILSSSGSSSSSASASTRGRATPNGKGEPYPTPRRTPAGAGPDKRRRVTFADPAEDRRVAREKVMSLYSLGSGSGSGHEGGGPGGETLVVNVVTGKKRCEWLKQELYPGAVLRFFLPPPSPNHTISSDTEVSNALTPPYIQTIIPAPSASARGLSPTPSRSRSRSATPTSSDDSIVSLHDLLSAPAPTIERPTTLLATLEFPLGVGVEVGLVEEGDAAGAKFREKIEGRIFLAERLEQGWDGVDEEEEDVEEEEGEWIGLQD